MTEETAVPSAGTRTGERPAGTGAAAEFERLYRANVDAVTAYFARRTVDPQVVADLTADTFVAVITGFASFDPRKGTARAWLFGIAGHVYAAHCAAYSQQQHRLERLGSRRELDQDQVDELLERIDAERAARGLLAELARLPERYRAVPFGQCGQLGEQAASCSFGVNPVKQLIDLVRVQFAPAG